MKYKINRNPQKRHFLIPPILPSGYWLLGWHLHWYFLLVFPWDLLPPLLWAFPFVSICYSEKSGTCFFLWSENHSVTSNSLRSHGLYSSRNSPGQSTGVGSCSLLPNPGIEPRSPTWQVDSLPFESPRKPCFFSYQVPISSVPKINLSLSLQGIPICFFIPSPLSSF